MHRTIEIALSPAGTEQLLAELRSNEHVLGLSIQRGASIKPPGDIVVVQTLNRGADAVMQAVAAAGKRGPVSVATAELASLTDVEHQKAIDNDVDEALWEELETGLRHQGKVTSNFLCLMSLGGVIAGAGLIALDEPHLQTMAAVAAAVIAPGFEPLAKIPLGIILKRREVVWRGIISTILGYAVLILAAAITYWLLKFLGGAPESEVLAASKHVKALVEPSRPDLVISACGAFAGIVIQSAFRRSVIAGALIAMRLIDAAALIGIALALGRFDLVGQGLERLGLDLIFIIGAGLIVFGMKQIFVHRRAPIR